MINYSSIIIYIIIIVIVNDKPIEVVHQAKILGLTIYDTLSWNNHVNDITKNQQTSVLLGPIETSQCFHNRHHQLLLHMYLTNF